jgi:hypothetical protein
VIIDSWLCHAPRPYFANERRSMLLCINTF